MNGLIWFWHGGFCRPVLHCDLRKLGYLQKQGYFPLIFLLNYGLRKFPPRGTSIVERAINLVREKVDAQSVISWTIVCQLSWQYFRRSTTVFYRRDHRTLSTARFCRAGQLATADTCLSFQSDVDHVCVRLRSSQSVVSAPLVARSPISVLFISV